jgi:putative ABC transport system permease protein
MAFMLPPDGPRGEPVRAQASIRFVSPRFFEAMGTEILKGRGFRQEDATTSLGVIVVNEAFVDAYLTSRAAVGTVLPVPFGGGRDRWEIAGVVENIRHGSVDDPVQPQVFLNYRQLETGLHTQQPFVIARTSGDPVLLANTLREIVAAEDPTIALESITTMEDRLLSSLDRPRFYAIIVAAFAVSAVTIAAVGLFGVLSYSVAQRTREIGVRAALGAQPRHVAALVLRQGLGITAAGLIVGLAAALAVGQTLESFMFGVTTADAISVLAVPALLLPVAGLACYLPMRRAMRIDPVQAFRQT